MDRNKPHLLPRYSNFPTAFGPFHPLVCVLSPVRKGGAGVDKEGGLDVITTFGLARNQGINPGEPLMKLHQIHEQLWVSCYYFEKWT